MAAERAGSQPASRPIHTDDHSEGRACTTLFRRRVRICPLRVGIRRIAGCDVSFERTCGKLFAAVVVFDWPGLEQVESATAVEEAVFPYVPGYLSFREGPVLEKAYEKLERRPHLVMFDGHVQRYEPKSPSKGAQIVAFDQYMLNISDLTPKTEDQSKELRPRERYIGELLDPDPKLLKVKGNDGQIRTEVHDRFSTPFYPLLFAVLAVAVLGHQDDLHQQLAG